MIRTGRVRIELNHEGIREMLRSLGVSAEIERRAERVASAANTMYAAITVGGRDKGDPPGEHIEAVVKMGEGKNRARARVVAEHPAARAVEAKDRVLGRSVDAAKG